MPSYVYTRIRPNDLFEVALDQSGNTTIDNAIAAILANDNRSYACPKCKNRDDQPTGWNDIKVGENTFKVVCTVCEGFLKTEQVWMPDPSNPGSYIALFISGISPVSVGTQNIFTASVAGGTWASSDEGIATVVSNTGSVSPVAGGTTNITYTKDGYVATFPLTVNPAV